MPGRHTTFTLTLVPNAAGKVMLAQHCGAARFAYNRGLAQVKSSLEARQASSPLPESQNVLWSAFDRINAFHRWNLSAAGGSINGEHGLPWRTKVCAQVFEEGLVDLGDVARAVPLSQR